MNAGRRNGAKARRGWCTETGAGCSGHASNPHDGAQEAALIEPIQQVTGASGEVACGDQRDTGD